MLRSSLVCVVLSLFGCGDDDHHHHGTGACGQIVSACHDLDPGTGPISECHALGHDEVEAECDAQLAHCLSVCVASDAGTPTDAHVHDHDGGHAHDASTSAVCSELASLCHDASGELASECHDLGHDGDEATCVARESECRAACEHAGHDH